MTPSAIRLFGLDDSRIETPLATLSPSAETVFATGLVLGFDGTRAIDRGYVQEIVWPGVSSTVSAHRLRQTLVRLRHHGFPIETVSTRQIRLGTDEVSYDFNTIPSLDLSRLLLIKRILPGISAASPTFAEWLDAKRSSIGLLLCERLLVELAAARKRGDWITVEQAARSILVHSDSNEEATLALSESLALRGNKAAAIRVLDDYTTQMGHRPKDLHLQSSIMRRRISERLPLPSAEAPVDTPFLGRTHYLESLSSILTQVRNGQSRVAIVTGEAGIGKSRLANEFLSFAALQGIQFQIVTCRASDATRPLAVMLELVPLLRQMRGAIGSSPETLRFFDALTTHRPERHQSDAKSYDLLPGALNTALNDILEAVTDEYPLIIAIENSQWIDATSLDAFSRLAETLETQRVLFLFTTRISDQNAVTLPPNKTTILELSPLDDSESTEILNSIFGGRSRTASPDHVRWCASVAEGNPYFLHELANQWLETGEEHASPRSLVSVLQERLGRLHPDSLQVLQACAVLENESSVENLEDLLGYRPHQLLQSVEELSKAGMLVTNHERGVSSRISSKHDLLAEAALSRLATPSRAYLHRCAARLLQKRISGEGDVSTLWSCAKHWQLAGDVSQAFRLALSCANHLLDVGLPQDAVEIFDGAFKYCVTDADRLTLLEAKAKALYRSSNLVALTAVAEEFRTLRAKLNPGATDHDELELMQLRAEWLTHRWREILARSWSCLRETGASVEHRMDAAVMALMMLSFSGDGDEARKVVDIVDELSPTRSETPAQLQVEMIYNTNWGSFEKATEAAYGLVRLQRQLGDVAALFTSMLNAAVTLRAACRIDESRKMLLEALDVAEQHRLYLTKSRGIPLLAHMALEHSQNTEARYWLEQLEKIEVARVDSANVDLATIRTRLALCEGDVLAAERLLNVDLLEMRTDYNPHRRTYASALTVVLELARDGAPSASALTELEEAHLQSRGNVFQAFAAFALFVGLKTVGQASKGQKFLDEYLSIYRREPCPPPAELLASIEGLAERHQREVLTS